MQRQGEPVELTGTEFELLALLAREPQKVFSRDEILEPPARPRRPSSTPARSTSWSAGCARKLEPLDCIKTLRNAGYAFAGARV